MGLFDKVKNAIGGMTDETVREITDKEELKRAKLEKRERERREREEREKRQSQSQEAKASKSKKDSRNREDDYEEVDITSDTSFLNNGSKNSSPEDILENEGIPATYEIDKKILLPEDMSNVKFNEQVPVGYDMGDVRTFMRIVKDSLAYYRNIIDERQEHIARLATRVQDLIVENNNLRYRNEAADGINIMASEGTEELEAEIDSLRIQNQKLEDENSRLKKAQSGEGLTSDERSRLLEKNKEFSNTISLLQRQVEDLKTEIHEKNVIITNYEEEDFAVDKNFPGRDDDEEEGFTLPDEDEDDDYGLGESSPLEEIPEDDEDVPLPDEEVTYSGSRSKYSVNSEFEENEYESLDEFIESHKEDFSKQSEPESTVDVLEEDYLDEDGYDFFDKAVSSNR